jgi:pentatricopeptide repeat protein
VIRRNAPLIVVLVVGLATHAAYALTLGAHDPTSLRPALDGAYYVDWARALAGGGAPTGGAFYLAPLYAYLLSAFFRTFGSSLGPLFLLQEAAVVGAAALLGGVSLRLAGTGAAVGTAVLLIGYHPPMFFAARPVGESAALLLLAGSLALALRAGQGAAALGGGIGALAALARPNLLAVPAAWSLTEAVSRRWVRAVLIAGAAAAVLLPVAAVNAHRSGHWVPISSNGGITLYHGNGPGATGVFTPPRGLSGRLDTQREEATRLAQVRSGRPLDPVEADAWWGREAARARLDDPLGTARLIAWRVLLLLDNHEHGLDYAPALDTSPWRFVAPVPFAALLGLTVFGVAALGWRTTGGAVGWGAIVACAATPVAFYAASRYRLPFSVLLCGPAGIGADALVRAAARRAFDPTTVKALVAGAVAALISVLVPSGSLVRSSEAGALANRAALLVQAGDLPAAEEAARAGIARDPEGLAPRFQLALVLERRGRAAEAEAAYHDVVVRDPGHAAAAANLSRLLLARSEPAQAVPILRDALRANPTDALCWNNLVVALAMTGDREEARTAWHEAKSRGVELDRELLEAVGGGT